jgi:hypothetical protein
MYFELDSRARHTGTERYTVTYRLREQDDLYDVKGAFVQYTIRPETVRLTWERTHTDGVPTPWWRLMSYHGYGSRITGPRVLKSGGTSDTQDSYVDVFRREELGSPLTEYAASLPHLQQMIDDAEHHLPA